jgi:hypothetical protein
LALKLNLFHPELSPTCVLLPNETLLARAVELVIVALALTGRHQRWRYGGRWLLLAATGIILYWIQTHQPLINGLGNVPIYAPLRMRQFFPFVLGFIFPIVFLSGFLWALHQQWGRRVKTTTSEQVLIICVWGLWLYVEFVLVPSAYAYGTMAIAVIMLAMAVLNVWLLRQRLNDRVMISVGICLIATALLLTNRLFLTYPRWNVGRGLYQQERSAFKNVDDALSQDAQLINAYIPEGQKVFIISSLERFILFKAGRQMTEIRPPLLSSERLDQSNLPLSYLKTNEEFLAVVQQLQTQGPPIIFVERKLMQFNQALLEQPYGASLLVKAVLSNYQLLNKGTLLDLYQKKAQ